MLPKTPKSAFWKYVKGGAKTIFIVEAFCFAVSYGVYYRMNTNREFRQYVNENLPFALDYYYKIGELVGNSDLRQIDSKVWQSQQNKPE